MMSWVWFGLIAVSIIFGIITGRINEVSQATITGASDAVVLFLTLLATISLWSGLMKIADKSGITALLQKLLSPITGLLFKDLEPGSDAIKAISMNIAANLMGLGNAATPLGLKAMKEMSKKSNNKSTASDSMVTFVVINTASIQLIPTTIAAIRLKYGSSAPFEIVPAIWFASVITLCFGVLTAKVMSKRNNL